MIDISDPKNPVRTDIYRTNYAENVTVQGYAYVADSSGMRVVQILIPKWLIGK